MSPPATECGSRLSATWQYRPLEGFHDEMLSPNGDIRPHWKPLVDALNAMGPAGLHERWQEGRRLIRDNGITYNVYGDPQSTERPWPLDAVPFLVERREWEAIEAAIIQRATLLNHALRDLYGPQRLLRDRKLPPELIFEHPGFLRPCCGAPVPGNIWLHSYSA